MERVDAGQLDLGPFATLRAGKRHGQVEYRGECWQRAERNGRCRTDLQRFSGDELHLRAQSTHSADSTVGANTAAPRSAVLTVAGEAVTVTQ
jgi:hypothetical protein